jgi:hypothetical protein
MRKTKERKTRAGGTALDGWGFKFIVALKTVRNVQCTEAGRQQEKCLLQSYKVGTK